MNQVVEDIQENESSQPKPNKSFFNRIIGWSIKIAIAGAITY